MRGGDPMNQSTGITISGYSMPLAENIVSSVLHVFNSNTITAVRHFNSTSICPKAQAGNHVCLFGINQTIVLSCCQARMVKDPISDSGLKAIGNSQTTHLSIAKGQDLKGALSKAVTCLQNHDQPDLSVNNEICPLATVPAPRTTSFWRDEPVSLPLSLDHLYRRLLCLEHLNGHLTTGKAEFNIPNFVIHLNQHLSRSNHQVAAWFIPLLIDLQEQGLVEMLDGTLLVRRVKLNGHADLDLDLTLPPPPSPDDELVKEFMENARDNHNGRRPAMSRPKGSGRTARSRPAPKAKALQPAKAAPKKAAWPPNPFTGPQEVLPEDREAYQALRLIANRAKGDFSITGPDSSIERWAKEHDLPATRLKRGLAHLREKKIVRVIDPRRHFFTIVVYAVELRVIEPAPRVCKPVPKAPPKLVWPPNPFKNKGPQNTTPEAVKAYLELRNMTKQASGDVVIRGPKRTIERWAKEHDLPATRLLRGLKQLRDQGIAIVVDKSRHSFTIVLYDVKLQTTEPPPRVRKGRPSTVQREGLIAQVERGEANSFPPQFSKLLAPLGKLGPQVWAVILDIVRTENGQTVCARNPVINLVSKVIKLGQERGINRTAIIRVIGELRQQEVLTPLNPDKKHCYDFIVHNARFQEPVMPPPSPPATNNTGNQLLWLMVASPVPLAEVARRLANGKKPIVVLGGTALDSVGLDLNTLLAPKS